MSRLKSLGAKLFLSQALSTLAIVIVLAALFWLGLGQGFKNYVAHIELAKLTPLDQYLTRSYKQYHSWGFVRNARDLLPPRAQRHGGIPDENFSPGIPGNNLQQEPEMQRPAYGAPPRDDRPAPHADMLSLGQRLALFDEKGEFVVGPVEAKGTLQRKLYDDEGNIIGFLSLAPSSKLDEGIDQDFIAQQARNLFLSCVLAIVVSAFVAAFLARYFRRPISALAEASRQLAKGDLRARVYLERSDELGSLAQDFNLMAKRLEDFEVARRQWVADTSHELRTPLTILRLQVEALRDGIVPFSAHSLGSIESAITDLDRLVIDLYQLARSDVGIYDFDITDLSLVDLIDEIQEHFSQALQQADLNFIVTSVPNLQVRGDSARLHQLFCNLLSNSIRYSHPGGMIVCSAIAKGNFVEITLDDSPPGVPENALSHLFERFYRVDTSHSRRSGGSGLGLSICQSIVEGLSGEISAHHSDLGGLRIIIKLPLSANRTAS